MIRERWSGVRGRVCSSNFHRNFSEQKNGPLCHHLKKHLSFFEPKPKQPYLGRGCDNRQLGSPLGERDDHPLHRAEWHLSGPVRALPLGRRLGDGLGRPHRRLRRGGESVGGGNSNETKTEIVVITVIKHLRERGGIRHMIEVLFVIPYAKPINRSQSVID